MELRSNEPTGPIEHRWEKHKEANKLVAPANRRKYNIIVVGSGLLGRRLFSKSAHGRMTGFRPARRGGIAP